MGISPFEEVFGPILVGIIIDVFLFGIMVMQTYIYSASVKSDKKWIQIFIWLLFFANLLKTAFECAFLYGTVIRNFGKPDKVGTADWLFLTDPAMTAIIGGMVQAFYAWRIKVLTGSTPLTLFVLFTCTVQTLSGIATAIASGIVKYFIEFQKIQVVVILWLAFSAVTDIIIAITLVFTLKKCRTGFMDTDDLIDRLIRTTVQTGALTAAVALIDLILFLTSTSGLHLAFNFPLAHLYTNSLLSSLNARAMNQLDKQPRSSSNILDSRPTRIEVELKSRATKSSKIGISSGIDSPQFGDENPTKVYMEVEEITEVSPADKSKGSLSA